MSTRLNGLTTSNSKDSSVRAVLPTKSAHEWDNVVRQKEICKWCVTLFEPCLDPDGSGRELSVFDKLDVRRSNDFELQF